MDKINLAGLNINTLSKTDFLSAMESRIKSGQKTFVTTPYSEFLYESFQQPALLDTLNQADFSVPDGIGMLWAATFLNLPLKAKSYNGKILESLWQTLLTLAAILFNPAYIKKVIPEKIVGADLIWDLADLAVKNNWSVYLLGGFGNTTELAAKKLQKELRIKNHELRIAGWSNKNPDDQSIIEDINAVKPDVLFVAFGPIRQEKWITENLNTLNVKLAIGLGGTFDYLAGKYQNPPIIVRNFGLEWLWRLVTQPRRWRRIYNATFGFVTGLVRYKVYDSLPLRPNVAIVILNKENKVLVCERNPKDFNVDIIESMRSLMQPNYWQLPQGGIDKNENLIEAGKREGEEEVGLSNLDFLMTSKKTHDYLWNNTQRKLSKNRYHRNKGQTQQVVYFRFLGGNNEVKIDGREFVNYKWIGPKELQKTIHPERQGLTNIVLEDLEQIIKT